MAELEWLRRNLVGPGLLPASRLDAWLVGWTPERPLLRHLAELGVLDAAGVGTISAAIKGYLRIEAAALVGLFRGGAPDGPSGPVNGSRDVAEGGGDRPDVRRDRSNGPGAIAGQSSRLRAAVDAALSTSPGLPTRRRGPGEGGR